MILILSLDSRFSNWCMYHLTTFQIKRDLHREREPFRLHFAAVCLRSRLMSRRTASPAQIISSFDSDEVNKSTCWIDHGTFEESRGHRKVQKDSWIDPSADVSPGRRAPSRRLPLSFHPRDTFTHAAYASSCGALWGCNERRPQSSFMIPRDEASTRSFTYHVMGVELTYRLSDRFCWQSLQFARLSFRFLSCRRSHPGKRLESNLSLADLSGDQRSGFYRRSWC